MVKKLIIIIAILLPLTLSAQVGKLVGSVVDKETGQALERANVWIPGTKIGAASDMAGKFFLPGLTPGKYTFNVSVIGYRTAVLDSIVIEAWKTSTLDVELEQTLLQSESIIIKQEETKH